jgi:flagellar biosynthesis/type III secretory pathway protein FliH
VLTRARVLSAKESEAVREIPVDRSLARSARLVLRERIEATAQAERLIAQARIEAAAVVERAREAARAEAAIASEAARLEADAQGAARWLAVRREEQLRLEHDADRVVSVAILIAERLLGAALELEPGRVAAIARVALAEAGGARQAVIEAHPVDAEALRRSLRAAGLGEVQVEVRENAALGRGDLRLHTDLGPIDARLATRFEQLACAVRDIIDDAANQRAPEPPLHG